MLFEMRAEEISCARNISLDCIGLCTGYNGVGSHGTNFEGDLRDPSFRRQVFHPGSNSVDNEQQAADVYQGAATPSHRRTSVADINDEEYYTAAEDLPDDAEDATPAARWAQSGADSGRPFRLLDDQLDTESVAGRARRRSSVADVVVAITSGTPLPGTADTDHGGPRSSKPQIDRPARKPNLNANPPPKRSLFCLSITNPFRRVCIRIVDNKYPFVDLMAINIRQNNIFLIF